MGKALRSNCCNAKVVSGPGNVIAKENNNDKLMKVDNVAAKPEEITKCRDCGRLLSEADVHEVDTTSTVSVGLQTKKKVKPEKEEKEVPGISDDSARDGG